MGIAEEMIALQYRIMRAQAAKIHGIPLPLAQPPPTTGTVVSPLVVFPFNRMLTDSRPALILPLLSLQLWDL